MAESNKPITKKPEKVDESSKKFGGEIKKPDSEDGNNQTPSKENVTGIKSLGDTLTFKKRGEIFLY